MPISKLPNQLIAALTRLLPVGGVAGQIPVKASEADGDVVWQTPSGVTKGKVIGINSKQYL